MQNEVSKISEIIKEIKAKSADGDCIFRGEPECYEKVTSTLYRKFKGVAQVDIERLQKQLLNAARPHDFNRLGCSQSQRYAFLWSGGYDPTKYSEREFEILSELQHWGGETNLIDFTTDYRVALFFACDTSHNKDGRIIILERATLLGKIWKPTEPRHRIQAQSSIFVQPSDGFIQPNLENIILIPKALKVPMLKYLARQSPPITTPTMFNDLHGYIKVQKRHREAYVKFYIAVDYEEQGDSRGSNDPCQRAVNYYREAIELMPNLVMAHIRCGIVSAKLKDFDSAIHHFREAIDWDPTAIDAHNNLGNAYCCKGNLDLAMKCFNTAIELNPNDSMAHNNLGNAYYLKGDLNRAMASYATAIELNPDNSAAHNNLGNAYYLKGDLNRAMKCFNTAITAYSRRTKDRNDNDEINTGIDFGSGEAAPYYSRIRILLRLKEWERAKSDLTMASEKGMNISAFFLSDYSCIEDFEKQYGVELPEDITAMLEGR